MDDMKLDGNAIAGLLRQVFTAEMTTAIGTCGECGESEVMGALHAYQGAGVVLRCPKCDHALVKIVSGDARIWISFAGVRTLEVAVGGT